MVPLSYNVRSLWVRKVTSGATAFGVALVVFVLGAALMLGEGVKQAFRMLRRGGRISLLGIPSQPVTLDLAADIIFKGVTVLGINGRRMWKTWYQAQALLRSGKVDLSPLITHTFPLREIHKGMDLLKEGQAAKIIIYP